MGPVSQFQHLVDHYSYAPEEAANKVKKFNRAFLQNRHKAAVLTPGLYLHLEGSDDQRSDQRPLLGSLEYQFKKID